MDEPFPASSHHTPTWLVGIPTACLGFEETVETVLQWATDTSEGLPPNYVATSNVDFLVKTLSWAPGSPRHPELQQVLREAAINTADGMPLVWASRLLGGNIRERVSGSDLVPEICRQAAERGVSVFLLGGESEVAEEAARRLRDAAPALDIAGIDSPFVHTEGIRLADEAPQDVGTSTLINTSGARILFVGFGNPKQEIWFRRNAHRLDARVVLGIGGTYNFLAGKIGRAPAWMQRTGLEWVHRLVSEPRRLWKRYAIGSIKLAAIFFPVFAAHSLLKIGRHFDAVKLSAEPMQRGLDSLSVLRVPDALGLANAASFVEVCQRHTDATLILDFSGCRFVDATGLGVMWWLQETCKASGRSLLLLDPHWRVRLLFRLHRADDVWQPYICRSLEACLFRIADALPGPGVFVSIEHCEETVVLHFLGSLHTEETARLDKHALLSAVSGCAVVVQLRYCSHVDNDGLGLLLQLANQAEREATRFLIDSPRPRVVDAIRVAGLAKTLLNE